MLDSGGYGRLLSEGEYALSPRQHIRLVDWWSQKAPGRIAAFQQDHPADQKVADSIDRWYPWEEAKDLAAACTEKSVPGAKY